VAARGDIKARLLATFQVEAEEHVEALTRNLLALEQGPPREQEQELVEATFRAMHTLKGAARSVALVDVEALCQACELVLSRTVRGHLTLTPAIVDALQEAVVRCWRDIRGLRDPDRFEAWLYRLVVNASRDHMRRQRRAPHESGVLPPDLHATGDDYARLVEHDALEGAFLTLSADHRIVLLLAHYAGYSAPEIATILSVPTGTVYSRLHYAMRAMRAALAPPLGVPATTTGALR